MPKDKRTKAYKEWVKKYGDPDVLEYVKSESQNINDKSVKASLT